MTVLRVSGLKKVFSGTVALNGISFHLNRAEILGILGPNGAGKTTLIHCLLGLIEPTEGTIEVFGMNLHRNRSTLLSRMNFASNYVSLPYSLTVEENLRVYAYLYEVQKPLRRINEVLEMFEISHLRHKPTRSLSSGQMMRLCLAKALLNKPELLLLDEPTAGLDPEIADRTRKLLRRLKTQESLSVIYTSHNLREIETVSDRVLFLHKGTVIAEGPSERLLHIHGVENLEQLFFKFIYHNE